MPDERCARGLFTDEVNLNHLKDIIKPERDQFKRGVKEGVSARKNLK